MIGYELPYDHRQANEISLYQSKHPDNLISFLISFLLVVFFVHFYCPFTPANFMQKFFTLPTYIYIYNFLLFYFTTHLIMTEARSKRRVLPLVFIVKSLRNPYL